MILNSRLREHVGESPNSVPYPKCGQVGCLDQSVQSLVNIGPLANRRQGLNDVWQPHHGLIDPDYVLERGYALFEPFAQSGEIWHHFQLFLDLLTDIVLVNKALDQHLTVLCPNRVQQMTSESRRAPYQWRAN